MLTLTYTHKGWLGFCPIYIGNIEADGPDGPCLKARHWSLEWLLDLSTAVLGLGMFLAELCGREPEGFPILVGPELAEPITDKVEV